MRVLHILDVLFILILLLISSVAYAEDFLSGGFGAAAMSMGGAYLSGSSGADSVYYNPANLTGVTKALFQSSQASSYTGGMNEYHFAYIQPIGFATVGISVPLQVVDGILQTQENSSTTEGEILGSFDYTKYAVVLSLAAKLGQNISYGVNAKYISEQSSGYHGQAIGLDAGCTVQLSQILSISGAAQNIGGENMGWDHGTSETQNTVYQFGVAIKPQLVGMKTLLEVDYSYENEINRHLSYGVQVKPNDLLALRAGGNSLGSSWSCGLGLEIENLIVDYAYETHQDLGNSSKVSISFKM